MVQSFVKNFDQDRVESFTTKFSKLCNNFEWIVKLKKINESSIEAAINRLPKAISQKQSLKEIFEAEQVYLRFK